MFIRTLQAPRLNQFNLLLLSALPTLFVSQTTLAQSTGQVTTLDEVTVSSTRTERRVDTVPTTVSVKTAEQIEEQGARDLKDVFKDEIDVTVPQRPTRFTTGQNTPGRAGNEGINVRGLEGNQVLIMQDGIRVPNSFNFGAFSSGRGDFTNIDGIKAVEILRGPASTQYGSDSLAGAILFRSLDPSDLLKAGQPMSGYLRSSFASIDSSWSNAFGVAAIDGKWQGLIVGSYKQGHEVDNRGDNSAQNSNRTAPNPVDYRNPYVLAKLMVDANEYVRLGITLESQHRTQDTHVISAIAPPPLSQSSVTGLQAEDEISRERVSLNYRYLNVNAPYIQRIESHFYSQQSEITQNSTQQYQSGLVDRVNNVFNSDVIGFSTLFETNIANNNSQHNQAAWQNQRITYGFDWSKSSTDSSLRGLDGVMFKPFPNTDFIQTGAFIQSEIEFNQFTLIPAVRYDRYKLDPSSSGYHSTTASLSDSAVTPRLGFVWQLSPVFAPFGQIAKGFKAPSPDQVNNSFGNVAHGYYTIGNPNLKAESAKSIELGFRGKINNVRYAVTAYDNDYQDFINQQIISGTGKPADPFVFQYVNLAKARIHGVEARAEWAINPQWISNFGVAYSKGESELKNVTTPLNTVQPLKAVLGIRYNQTNWDAHATVIHNSAKNRDQIAPPPPRVSQQFATPSSTVLDVGANWRPNKNWTVTMNINNLFNDKYWRWSDVNGLAQNSAIKDAFTAAGRTYQIAVRYDF